MSPEDHIKEISQSAFNIIKKAYNQNNQAFAQNQHDRDTETRLVFPKYYHGKNEDRPRVSEQEYRFAFVEAFNKYVTKKELDWYYSVETPTMDKYAFTEDAKGNRSACFDLVIFDSHLKRLALIEFKAGIAKQSAYNKDYEKLKNPKEECELRFFINIFEHADNNTYKKLAEKIKTAEKEANSASPINVTLLPYALVKK